MSDGKYTTLEFVSFMLKVVGLVSLVGFIIFGFSNSDPILFMVGIVCAAVISLPILVFSELIQVIIDIEDNTRTIYEEE